MPDLLLGLDVGTTSTRSVIFDGDGNTIGSSQLPLSSNASDSIHVEQDLELLWNAVVLSTNNALKDAECSPTDLFSIGVTTQRSSIAVWEKDSGKPVAPMVVWNDLRGINRSNELREAGYPVMAIAAASKLEAVIDDIPDGRVRASNGSLLWGTLDSYLLYRISGGDLHVTDRSCAWSSAYLDFFNPSQWNEKLISYQGFDIDFFPSLCSTTGHLGFTTPDFLGATVPIGSVVADQQAGMFAHGITDSGGWKATYGTSGVLMVSTGEDPHFSSPLTPMLLGGWDDKTLFASEGMVRSAGEMIPWAVSKGIASSISEFFSLVDTASDSGELFVLPALHGLGTPYNDPEAVVLIQGESSSSSKGDLAKGILEGIAFRMSEIVELSVESLGLESNTVLPIDGGLSRSDAFCQIQADLLGRPLVRHSTVEATVYGAAVAGGQGIGSDICGSSNQGDIFEPIFTRDEADEKLSKWQKQVLPDK